jgi:hypothetical protein
MNGCVSVSEYLWNSFEVAWAKAFRLPAMTGLQRRPPIVFLSNERVNERDILSMKRFRNSRERLFP